MKKRRYRFRHQAKRLYFSRPKPTEQELDFLQKVWIPMLQIKLAAARQRLLILRRRKKMPTDH